MKADRIQLLKKLKIRYIVIVVSSLVVLAFATTGYFINHETFDGRIIFFGHEFRFSIYQNYFVAIFLGFFFRLVYIGKLRKKVIEGIWIATCGLVVQVFVLKISGNRHICDFEPFMFDSMHTYWQFIIVFVLLGAYSGWFVNEIEDRTCFLGCILGLSSIVFWGLWTNVLFAAILGLPYLVTLIIVTRATK